MGKKGNKGKKTLSLSDFQSQGGPVPKPRNALPTAPGEAVDRGYGGNRRGGGNRSGGRGGGYGDQERSRADESNMWRRNGPPKKSTFGGSFGGGNSSRDRGDRSFGGDRGDRGDRAPRRNNDGPGDESFSRSAFGTKKQTGNSFGGGSSSFRNRDSDRGDRGSRMGSSFGSNSFGSSRGEDRGDDDFGAMDRSKWGQRKVAIRPTSGRTTGRNTRSFGGMDQKKRGEFDGSGKGFGAQLVSNCFLPLEQNENNNRTTYTEKKLTAWNQPVHQKSEEQLQKEKERKEEREKKQEEERKTREESQAKKDAARKKKEDEQKKKEHERKTEEAERKRMEDMRNAVTSVMESDDDAVPFTVEQCEIVLPEINCNEVEAKRIGVAIGMSVHSEVIGMNDVISLVPTSCHDIIIASMFDTIVKRVGESKFLRQIDNNEIDFGKIIDDPDNFEKILKDYGLTCLLGGDDDDGKLDEAFSEHKNLKELNALLADDPISPALQQRIFTYVCDEFFTERDIMKPEEWFDDYDFFMKITTEEKHVSEFIDSLIASWFKHGMKPDMLVNLFDHLIRVDITPASLVMHWNMMSEANMDAKMKALVSTNDFRFKADDEIYEGENFASWLSQIDAIYPEPEEEDEDAWDEHAV